MRCVCFVAGKRVWQFVHTPNTATLSATLACFAYHGAQATPPRSGLRTPAATRPQPACAPAPPSARAGPSAAPTTRATWACSARDSTPRAWGPPAVLGFKVGVRCLFHLFLFLTASRMVLPKILVLTQAGAQAAATGRGLHGCVRAAGTAGRRLVRRRGRVRGRDAELRRARLRRRRLPTRLYAG